LARKVSSGANGSFVEMRTVSGSTISILSIASTLLRLGEANFSSMMRSSVNLTSSAVSVEPSWNLTLARSLTSSVPSSATLMLSARSGTTFILASNFIKPLKSAQMT
jgi:hypothetical protein